MTRTLLKMRASHISPEPGESYVVISPHPDDESLACGAWISSCVTKQVPIKVIVLTDGSASHPGHPALEPSTLARQRQSECREACRALGLPGDALEFWDLPDGQLDRLEAGLRSSILQRMSRQAESTENQIWLVPGWREGSTEHVGARALVADATRNLPNPPEIREYFIWAWRNPVRLWPMLFRAGWMCHTASDPGTKTRALACHLSQIAPTSPWTHPVMESFLTVALDRPPEFYYHSTS